MPEKRSVLQLALIHSWDEDDVTDRLVFLVLLLMVLFLGDLIWVFLL